ncbi:MAG: GAP family protein [Microthrixaceae bacterium]|nr:GAP family protein [Microthrixaceae bacterium]
MNWAALGDVLPQALAMALSPIPIVLVILVLVSPRARTCGPAFAAGWLAGLFTLTALAFAMADGADVATDSAATDGANLVQVALGLLFLVFAAKQWQKRPRPDDEPATPKLVGAIDSMPPLKVLGVGFVSAALNPKNLPLGISAGVTIAQASPSTGIVTVAAFAVVGSAAVLAAVASVLVLGERTREPLEQLKTWLLTNSATIMMIIFILLAAKMIGSGLALAS